MSQRTILVTGGNRGIGQAIVEGLAESTEDLILLGCRNLDDGASVAKKLGDNVKPVKIDLSTRDSLLEDIKALTENFPSIDVLVNNAGVLKEGTIEECTEEDIESSVRVNMLGPIYLTKALLPQMIKKGYGRIVNVSSGWGSFGEGLGGPFCYSATKAALNGVTLSVANSLIGNVKINSMCPGWVRTRMGGMAASRSPQEGAATAIWLCNLPEDGPNGGFFRDQKPIQW